MKKLKPLVLAGVFMLIMFIASWFYQQIHQKHQQRIQTLNLLELMEVYGNGETMKQVCIIWETMVIVITAVCARSITRMEHCM